MPITNFSPQHEFLVGIDSDGCVFDTMELKHKECFIPNFIRHYRLQGVSRYAREASEFVNLYSKSRGTNRFPALVEQLDWLRRRPEVRARNVEVPDLPSVRRWVERETRLGNPALEKAVRDSSDPELASALAWSTAVNQAIGRMVEGVPPFPHVQECLEHLANKADMLVVSATPSEALNSEWREHGIARYVHAIWGQEVGTKTEMLAVAAHYEPSRALMVGDAPGDWQAAGANKCLFFPINPGDEEASWRRFRDEGIERFFASTFAGPYQKQLLAEFDSCLPQQPPWPVDEA